jgi:hypothetical protein
MYCISHLFIHLFVYLSACLFVYLFIFIYYAISADSPVAEVFKNEIMCK